MSAGMSATAREFNLTSSELPTKTMPMMVRPHSYCMPPPGFQPLNDSQGLSQKGGYSQYAGAASPQDQEGSGRYGSPYSGEYVPGRVSHDGTHSGGMLSSKKRGRVRRYGQYGSRQYGNMELGLSPLSSNSAGYASPSSEFIVKSRPPSSTRKRQLEALGPAGTGFRPHMITVEAGENVVSKIMAFSRQGEHTVCILSGNGILSNVALRQPAVAGGTVTYEGHFEIVSLSGSFMLHEDGGILSRTGGLSVAVVGPDGRVIGGAVAGVMVAEMPVQVIMCSFLKEIKKNVPNVMKFDAKPTQAPVSGFSTQPHASGYSTQPHASGYSTQPHASGYSTQPHASGYVSQPHGLGYSSQPHASGYSSQPHPSGYSSQPSPQGFSGHCQDGQQGQGTTPSELSSLSSDESEDEGDEEHANGVSDNLNVYNQNLSSHASPFWMHSG